MQFEIQNYGPAVARLLAADRLPELGPGRPNAAARSALSELSPDELAAGRPIRDRVMLDACHAGLWLWHDFLDESHTISQAIETPTGSYWHGMMHRREPDFWNSKYWFRRVGDHPIFGALRDAAAAAARASSHPPRDIAWLVNTSAWDPFRWVDECEAIAQGRSPREALARQIARIEWRLLFDYGYRQAVEI